MLLLMFVVVFVVAFIIAAVVVDDIVFVDVVVVDPRHLTLKLG